MTAYPHDRWAWVEVNLGAIRRNTATIRKLLSRGTQLMCVVKADAYGHGAEACARAMRTSGATQFAVATVEEGMALRAANINDPILVLAEPPIQAIDDLIAHELMPAVYTYEFALAYGEAAAAANKVGRYHLAIDTGMTRIGVLPDDVSELRRSIDFHRGLECAGTFTHFATADLAEDWDLRLQVNRFVDAIGALRSAGLSTGLIHADNTPGTILHPSLHFDMVRAGIGLYGLHPSAYTRGKIDLVPAMSVRGRVTRVVTPPFGTGVGYGATYRVPGRSVQIATVPIGYADGLARSLSNRMDVIVKGVRAHQVGNICMDQFMFALDSAASGPYRYTGELAPGDLVTIMGVDGDAEITADELADLRGTINYEVVCDFGMRLEKVYA